MILTEQLFEIEQHLGSPNNVAPCSESELIIKLLGIIEKHYRSQHNELFYRNQLHTTYYYLNTRCQHYFGKSVNGLVQERLFKESCALLSGTLASVKTITYELGFSDPSNFNRFFKRHAGMTALEYRSSANNEALNAF